MRNLRMAGTTVPRGVAPALDPPLAISLGRAVLADIFKAIKAEVAIEGRLFILPAFPSFVPTEADNKEDLRSILDNLRVALEGGALSGLEGLLSVLRGPD
mmetsp:Transcript_57169/g.114687  ORF Transcript_57169/g.114687 Transcript_57169/m.114687 type:complete len:100 (-) Transcript_57169:1224-1523(-)